MKLIMRADDLGFSEAVNLGIIKQLKRCYYKCWDDDKYGTCKPWV